MLQLPPPCCSIAVLPGLASTVTITRNALLLTLAAVALLLPLECMGTAHVGYDCDSLQARGDG